MGGPTRSKRTAWTPWLALLLGGVATAAGTTAVHRSIAAHDVARFDQVVSDAEDRIVGRIEVHLAILRATAGLFASGMTPDVAQFRRYVRRVRLSEFYPGVQGVGYTRRIRPDELDAVEGRIRAVAFPDFRVWPEAPRDEYHAIVLLEPLERRNRAALGYDMFTEEVRRAAMVRARDSGRAAMSGKVTLVQEIEPDHQPGFLIYMPVFTRGLTPESVAERRATLEGYVYSPLRAYDFFRGVFQGESLLAGMAIYDGERLDPEALLFETGGAPTGSFEVVRTLIVADRPWTIRYRSIAAFDRQSHHKLPWVFAAVGALVSLLLFLLMRQEVRTRRANEAAARLRERLMAILGHDLRNPLSAIAMGTSALERKEGLDPSARAMVRRIDRSVQRMERLITHLLDFARIQEGMTLPIEPVEADVSEVVRQVVDEFQLANPDAKSRLELGGPAPARVDPDRLAEAVANLLRNALQHGRGAITVGVRERGPELLAIDVHNEGPAIPDEAVPGLFDPYCRGRERGSSGTRSLGLGLYIAREIVHGHRGRIEVRSSEAEGTTFTVVVPRDPDRAPRTDS